MISSKKGILIVLTFAVITSALVLYKSSLIEESLYGITENRLGMLEVDRGVFTISIPSAFSVEVWEIASSSIDIKEKAGDMKLVDGRWVLDIPKKPHLVYTYEARAYDEFGKIIDSKVMETKGEDEMYTMLWGPVEENTKEVSIGETFRYNDLEFTITDVLSDNRCPVGLQCVHPGFVEFSFNADSSKHIKKSAKSNDDILFDRYIIKVTDIKPYQKNSSKTFSKESYMFSLEILINTTVLPFNI